MKELFKVFNIEENKSIGQFFSDKKLAKKFRNELNSGSETKPFRVSRGKDHWAGSSFAEASKPQKEVKKKKLTLAEELSGKQN